MECSCGGETSSLGKRSDVFVLREAGSRGQSCAGILPEAGFHVLEAVIAGEVGQIELSDVSWSLIAKSKTFRSGQRGSDTISDTAVTMIATLSGAELNIGGGLKTFPNRKLQA